MKITALIPDELIEEVREQTGGKNITESLLIALRAYLKQKKLEKITGSVDEQPLLFQEDFTAYGIRKINRKK